MVLVKMITAYNVGRMQGWWNGINTTSANEEGARESHALQTLSFVPITLSYVGWGPLNPKP